MHTTEANLLTFLLRSSLDRIIFPSFHLHSRDVLSRAVLPSYYRCQRLTGRLIPAPVLPRVGLDLALRQLVYELGTTQAHGRPRLRHRVDWLRYVVPAFGGSILVSDAPG